MRRKLFVSLLLVVAIASLSSGAVQQQPQPAPQPTISAEDAALIAMVMFDEDDDCPDLTDPNAPPNRHFCELLARVRYELGVTTCEEYKDEWADCQGIPNLLSGATAGDIEQLFDSLGEEFDDAVYLAEFQFRIAHGVVE